VKVALELTADSVAGPDDARPRLTQLDQLRERLGL
jgi:hypothetical protein